MAINYSALISTLVKNLLKSGTFLYLSFEQNYPKLPASFCKCLCLVSQCKDICAEPWEMYQACSNGKYISAKCVRLLVSISPKRHSTNSFLLKTVLFLDLNKTLKGSSFSVWRRCSCCESVLSRSGLDSLEFKGLLRISLTIFLALFSTFFKSAGSFFAAKCPRWVMKWLHFFVRYVFHVCNYKTRAHSDT